MFLNVYESFFCLSALCALIALFGLCYSWFGLWLIKGIACKAQKQRHPPAPVRHWPKISILKPLHGKEPLLEEALESLLAQDYPDFEIIFGVADPQDPAIAVIENLQRTSENKTIKLVICPEQHGLNRKVSNLINIQKFATAEILVVADADIHVPKSWLKEITLSLDAPATGLVTAPYAGISAETFSLWQCCSRLGINGCFLPGVLTSRRLGRQDCFGATMALTQKTLSEIGGFEALKEDVADDARLGTLVRKTGRKVALLPVLTFTSVSENSFSELFTHELRWGRTTRSVQPFAYGASLLQFSLFWASLAFLFHPTLPFGLFWLCCLFSRWGTIALAEKQILSAPVPHKAFPETLSQKILYLALLPFPVLLREGLGACIVLLSFTGRKVRWAGQIMDVRPFRKSLTGKNFSFCHRQNAENSGLSLSSEKETALAGTWAKKSAENKTSMALGEKGAGEENENHLSFPSENRVRMACYRFPENFPYASEEDFFARLADQSLKSAES